MKLMFASDIDVYKRQVMILSIPLLSSSIPITITSIATTNPDMYSYRACP